MHKTSIEIIPRVMTRTNTLRLRRLGIDTQQETVVYMTADCHVCRSEGFSAHARIRVEYNGRWIIATLNHITSSLLGPHEASLSESAWNLLQVEEGDEITLSHPRPLESLSSVRSKVFGNRLEGHHMAHIIHDVVAGRYSDIHVSSFLTACAALGLDRDETIGLTRSMIDVGKSLDWGTTPIVDKHCIGGLPGNRTTPIVVAIVAAAGLTMPKTSSRAITSPAGTADTMETLAPVDLDLAAIRRVVESEGGCVVWGGAVRLSPADDILIRVERALNLDGEGQLIASVLSKKVAAGSTHLVLDVPVGPTAKVRSKKASEELSQNLLDVADEFGLSARVLQTDGTEPVGRGIGPALEARDVIAVLSGAPDLPADLRDRAIAIVGALFELVSFVPQGVGSVRAREILDDGRAWTKFQGICEAQGGMREPPESLHTYSVPANHKGEIRAIDNRQIAKVAKLAGAPEAKAAGVELQKRVGSEVDKGEPLYTVHAESIGELDYAKEFALANNDIFELLQT